MRLQKRKTYNIFLSSLFCEECHEKLLANRKTGFYWCVNQNCINYRYMTRGYDDKKSQSVHCRN